MILYELAAHVLKKENGTFRVHNTVTGERIMFEALDDALLYVENVDATWELSDDALRILMIYGWSLAPA